MWGVRLRLDGKRQRRLPRVRYTLWSHDADGNLTQSYVVGDMDCDGEVSFDDVE